MDLDQPNNGLPMEDSLMHDMPDIGRIQDKKFRKENLINLIY